MHMKLSMVVERERWALLQADGFLLPDPDKIMEETFRPSYEWMAARMLERLPEPQGPAWPLWAWAWYDGFDVSPPHERNDQFVVLEIEKPAEEVLLSEFNSWHCALNNWYLPDERVEDGGEAEAEAFSSEVEALGLSDWRPSFPDDIQSRIETSWSRSFDIRETDDIVQAVFFSLSLSEVIAVRPWDRPGSRRKRVSAAVPDGIGNQTRNADRSPDRYLIGVGP